MMKTGPRRRLGVLLSAALLPALALAGQRPGAPAPRDLAGIWDAEHVSSRQPPLINHAEVVLRIEALRKLPGGLFSVERAGESVEGRAIYHVRVGTGAYGVLLWSQMHGDEPTATAALFDLFEYLQRHREEAHVKRILSTLTLHVVPMLNPDGAELFQRRNAQGIDVNRDALRLQTPEGRVLKALRDRLKPEVGFNLHNQGWRTSVGNPPKPASISLLSVAYDEARSENAGRLLTKKICVVIRDALEPFAAGQIGRYDDSFEVRAFGDNITLWGTPVVLIETGGWPSAEPDQPLVRLNFVALVSALDSLATKSVLDADPQRYESLPLNESRAFYIMIRNAAVMNGAGVPPFTADIGIVANRRVREVDGRRELQLALTIEDLGDLRTSGAFTTIDATGMTVAPLGEAAVEAGQIVDMPEWKSKLKATIAVGQPARLMVLKPAAEPGKFVVASVVKE
jgi:hypothetical protein